MNSRLAKFLVVAALIIGAAESLVRANSDNFFALSDKLLLKVEILKRNPDTRVLCLGTSRFLDAIDERQFSSEIARLTGQKIRVMNAATTGSQGARFEYFAEIATQNSHLTHVILEADPPALQDGELNFPDQPISLASDNGVPPTFATRVEHRLQSWLIDHIAIARYRKVLRPATFEKLFVLTTADSISPNAWSRKGILRNFFVSPEVEITEQLIADFRPEIITRESVTSPPQELRAGVELKHLQRISKIFAASDIEVIWVAPPVSEEKIKSNHNSKYSDYYRDLAHRYGSEFYDYAGNSTDERYLRDSTHLNATGRFVFTAILAHDLAEKIATDSE